MKIHSNNFWGKISRVTVLLLSLDFEKILRTVILYTSGVSKVNVAQGRLFFKKNST